MYDVKKVLDCYYPGRAFPSVSTTGTSCSLRCKHCSARYLEGMIPATEPAELLSLAHAVADAGGSGFLVSGGSDARGRVALDSFLPVIKEIKATTSLTINAHIGLSRKKDLRELVGSGIDAFSVDVYGDDETVREVLGIPAKADDYLSVVKDLMDLGAPTVAPHMCVGVRGGELVGEMAAVGKLAALSPRTFVLISFIPTKGTEYESRAPPSGDAILSVIRAARSAMPDTRLVLGCMRSRRDRSWESDAVSAGLDGIVLPSTAVVDAASASGRTVRKKVTCCAIV